MTLEQAINAFISNRKSRLWWDLVKRSFIILLCGGFVYGALTTASSAGLAVVLSAMMGFGGWYVGVSPFLTNISMLGDARNTSPEAAFELLRPYGDPDQVRNQIEEESRELVIGRDRVFSRNPYFYLTQNWIVNLETLPQSFCMKIEDIKTISGDVYSTGYRWLYHFIISDAKGEQVMVIPLYSMKDQKKFIAHVLSINPKVTLISTEFTKRYFRRVYGK